MSQFLSSLGCRRACRRAGQRGQVIVLFALVLTVLLGGLGLALDLGFNYAQRRALQNATDAAVTIGLNDLVTTPSNTNADVTSSLAVNGFPHSISTASSATCIFLDNSGKGLGDCSTSPVPSSTSGLLVTVSETHNTFFMAVLGIKTSAVAATAAGHVQVANSFDSANIPFVVCGHDTALDQSDTKFSSGYLSIYAEQTQAGVNGGLPYESWPPQINSTVLTDSKNSTPDTFMIFASNGGSSGKGINDCGLGSDFKGALGQSSGTISISSGGGAWVPGQKGMKTGQVKTRVANGCNNTAPQNFNGCVVIVPIAEEAGAYPYINGSNQPACSGMQSNELCVDRWVAMKVWNVSNNRYTGQIVWPQPQIQADGSANWTVGGGSTSGGLITSQLTQ